MANDIDKTSPHYKGEFGSIYEVNQKFPSGGVQGDYVAIDGWAHYWNADRGTWCVNAQRDSYWDELITNIIEKFKLVRGATYMGVASLDTVPAKVVGAKMYYFATVAGTYKNFGDLVVPQGINVLYSENGSSWVNTTLLEVAQELGVSTKKVVSQKALNDALNLKANQSSVNEALAKKFDKTSVAQDSGDSEQLVMSQKAVTNKLSDLVKLMFNGNPDDVNFVGLGRGSSNFPYIVFSKPNEKTEYMIWQQGGKFIANKRTVNDDNTGWNQWERIRLDDSYILNFSICASNQNFGISDFIVSNAAKSSIIDISIYEEFAKGKDFILQKYGISDTDMYLFVQEVSNIEDKDSVIAFDVNKSFMANIKNVTSDNYKGLVKIKLQKNQNDTTEVGYVTIDVDLVKKHKFYATNNLTYNNAHIVPRLIHKDVEVTPKMFVKKEASKGLNVYCKLKDNLFIQYPLVYREKDADGLGETSEHIFYHNYGLFPLKLCSVKSISDVTIMYDIFREAEIEVAIAVNNSLGHFYFVGGYFHGFEDIVNYDNENRNVQILIDDKKIEEDEEYIGECKKIKVYQKSILYNSNAGKTDEIALLDKLWEFNDGKFTLDCTITISQDRTILRGFGNMFPVFRHNKGKSSEPYLTNKQIKDNNIYVVNDQSDGWDTGITSKLDFNCKSIIQYGELGFGFSVEQSDKNIIDKTGGMYTITNGSSYNKTYTAFAENKAVKKGDVFRIRNDWNFSYTK